MLPDLIAGALQTTEDAVQEWRQAVDWSRIVFEAAMTDDGFVSFMGTRHRVMVHLAMHDALNAIRPRFDQYAYFGRSTGANPIAAAAAAAQPEAPASGAEQVGHLAGALAFETPVSS